MFKIRSDFWNIKRIIKNYNANTEPLFFNKITICQGKNKMAGSILKTLNGKHTITY